MLSQPLLDTQLDGLSLVRRGKVRDVYAAGDALILVATDRISAFDYVLGSGIPDKGRVLNQLSAFWFARTRDVVSNHLLSTERRRLPGGRPAVREATRRPLDALPQDDATSRRVRGARLHLRIGMEGLQGYRRGLRHPAPKGITRIGSPARADLHACHEGRLGSRRKHQRSGGRGSGRRRFARQIEAPDDGAVRAWRGACGVERHHPRGYEIRVRHHRRRRADR